MKKLLISGIVVLVFIGYLWFQNQTTNPQSIDVTPGLGDGSTLNPSYSPVPTSNPASTPGSTIQPTATPRPSTGFKDGSYTSSVYDATYGPLQLSITIQNGRLVNVSWPQYPTDSGHTREVSDTALPILRTEAIAAQSANVDIVSGATQTSEAFQQALASLLSKAKA